MVQKLSAVVGVDKVLQVRLRALLVGKSFKDSPSLCQVEPCPCGYQNNIGVQNGDFCGIIFNSITLTFCFFIEIQPYTDAQVFLSVCAFWCGSGLSTPRWP